jgi:hypothetical protein
MEFGMVVHAPLLFWIGFAATLVLPFGLPRFGMVVGAIGTAIGAVFCANTNADVFARLITHELGTAALILSGLWLVTACVASIHRSRVRAVAEAV